MESYYICRPLHPVALNPSGNLKGPRPYPAADLATLELVASSKFYFTRVLVNKHRLYNILLNIICSISSGSSGRVRGGAEKHEIYAAAFGGHLFYDLFLQGQGGNGPLAPPPPRIRY